MSKNKVNIKKYRSNNNAKLSKQTKFYNPSRYDGSYLIIDLHGLEVSQAYPKIVLAISEAQMNNYPFIEIISGRGTGALQTAVIEIVQEYGLFYEHDGDGYFTIYFN